MMEQTHIPSYPWYINDWLSGSPRLTFTLEERGLFRDLLDHMYDQGSLPTNTTALMRMAACDAREFNRAWPKVSEQFVEKKGRLYNLRVEAEIHNIELHRCKLSDRGRRGGAAKQKNRLLRLNIEPPASPELGI